MTRCVFSLGHPSTFHSFSAMSIVYISNNHKQCDQFPSQVSRLFTHITSILCTTISKTAMPGPTYILWNKAEHPLPSVPTSQQTWPTLTTMAALLRVDSATVPLRYTRCPGRCCWGQQHDEAGLSPLPAKMRSRMQLEKFWKKSTPKDIGTLMDWTWYLQKIYQVVLGALGLLVSNWWICVPPPTGAQAHPQS